ncbi:MAG: hypothetical protein J5940_01070 [Clostridia bacterium]|nr:hypothetical protein [Clostridia bacterium]
MKKTTKILVSVTVLAALILSIGAMSACGKQGDPSNETSGTEKTADTSVFNYEKNDLSVYYKLASLDILTNEAIIAKRDKMIADATVTAEGEKVQLTDGSMIEADYILYNADMTKTLESGNFTYTLAEEEPFAGLYSAIGSSIVTIGSARIVRTLTVPEIYGEEDGVVMSFTVRKYVYSLLTSDNYARPLEYYRNALLLNYNKSLTAAEKAVEKGDTVVASYKLVARAENSKYKIGDVLDSSENFSFTVGGGNTLADFDSAFIGRIEGDSFNNEMTLPEGYGGEYMSNLDVTFECTVKKVSKPLNDAAAKAMGYESLEDFNKKTDADARERYIYSTLSLSLLSSNSQYVSAPEAALFNYRDEQTYYQYYYLKYLVYYSSLTGTTTDVDTLAKALYGYDTADDYLVYYFNSDGLKQQAKSSVGDTLLLFCFIQAAGLDISDEEFTEKYADDTAVIMGYDDASSYYNMADVCYDVTEERALAILKTDYYRLKAEEYFIGIAGK